eukprot:CAMPEP_0115220342 /NCGR_PEP_ID=MMETSP0270-20121206/27396_1 /TAXON_ID=71861 /ORGANISM="Scrippsiella trochoidea, Strain CCMP3099" /LENGTH=341 /DNA_ID=CAMNT_0002634391 /DNA_START=71 /DNA_END=1097 /DNA_ORIENTATION=+
MSAVPHTESESTTETMQLASQNIENTVCQGPPAKPAHDEETTDGGSNISDSEGSIVSGATATRSTAAVLTKEPAPKESKEPVQKAFVPVQPQGGKSRGGKSKGGRNQQPVSSLRSALRSKGNNVIAEVATAQAPFLTSSMARSTTMPVSQCSGPLATGCSVTAAPRTHGLAAAMPSYPIHAGVAAQLPRPNSVAIPCPRPPVAPAAAPVASPPGLEFAGASARGLYSRASYDPYHYNAMAYELECAFEQGRAFQREAATRAAMAAADSAYAADYAMAAAGPQKMAMYTHANEFPPTFDPQLPLKKRVSPFLADASTSPGYSWDAETAASSESTEAEGVAAQ